MKHGPNSPGKTTSPAAAQRRQRRTQAKPIQAPVAGSGSDDDVPLPHERDESANADSTAQPGRGAAGEQQRRVGKRAAADLAQGQVDTDMRATPGLDAERRDALTHTHTRTHTHSKRSR